MRVVNGQGKNIESKTCDRSLINKLKSALMRPEPNVAGEIGIKIEHVQNMANNPIFKGNMTNASSYFAKNVPKTPQTSEQCPP